MIAKDRPKSRQWKPLVDTRAGVRSSLDIHSPAWAYVQSPSKGKPAVSQSVKPPE